MNPIWQTMMFLTLRQKRRCLKCGKSQLVSRERVADHAEVYTAKREVNAMLDLVKQETERIDSRFLEPACGTGPPELGSQQSVQYVSS